MGDVGFFLRLQLVCVIMDRTRTRQRITDVAHRKVLRSLIVHAVQCDEMKELNKASEDHR